MDNTYQQIQQTMRDFDINADSEDVLDIIQRSGGRSGDVATSSMIGEEGNGNSGIDAALASDAKTLRENTALQSLIEKWTARRAAYQEKSQDSKCKAESRLSYLDKAVELELILVDLATLIEDAQEYRPSTEEKLRGATKAVSNPTLPAPKSAQESRDESDKQLARLLRNTKESIAYLNQNPKPTSLVE